MNISINDFKNMSDKQIIDFYKKTDNPVCTLEEALRLIRKNKKEV
ncbi:MAG: hypothetical protein ACW98X_25570 [Promethearchaeota archaeon]|jgi:hypothetical protein